MREIETDQSRRRSERCNNPKARFAQSCHHDKKSAPVRAPDAGHTVLALECFSFDIERLIPDDFLCLVGGNLVACDMSEIGRVPIKVELRTQSILYRAAVARSSAGSGPPSLLVQTDAEKYYWFKGRKKEIIIRAGPILLPCRRFTIVKDRKKEIGPGLLADMCRQLGIRKEDL
jgi:hypothetical protein